MNSWRYLFNLAGHAQHEVLPACRLAGGLKYSHLRSIMEPTSPFPAEEDLSRLLTAEQYSDSFCSVSSMPEDPESHIRVANKLSAKEELDRLLARRSHRPSVRGNSLRAIQCQSVPCSADKMRLA